MLSKSKPFIHATPITPSLDEHAFKKRSICLDGSLVKKGFGIQTEISQGRNRRDQGYRSGFQGG
ncbi:hypothetical protein AYX14_03830 [Cryptococcus neoformans]|nr:hypothetical protein AYX14_03830 [Cryptococcus neoformans var. grubii]